MAHSEKQSPGEQPSAAKTEPHNVDTETPSTKDATASELDAEGDDKPEKENAGSIKDYFVSR